MGYLNRKERPNPPKVVAHSMKVVRKVNFEAQNSAGLRLTAFEFITNRAPAGNQANWAVFND